jgi:glycosyltransferase involved in cell wall biosynthesis
MKVVCVIPAINEVKSLASVIRGLEGKVDQIILVDDGSTDGTEELARTLPLDLLRHPINRGQGAALKTGTIYALENDADIIVHFDADGQFRAEDIAGMIAPIIKGEAEIVFGSRFHDDTTKMPAFKRKVTMPLARFVNRFLFGINLLDPQSGFRALSRKAAEKIDWFQDEMAHCSEILVAAHKSGERIQEVPITVLYHQHGRGIGEGFKILRDFFLAKLNS